MRDYFVKVLKRSTTKTNFVKRATSEMFHVTTNFSKNSSLHCVPQHVGNFIATFSSKILSPACMLLLCYNIQGVTVSVVYMGIS